MKKLSKCELRKKTMVNRLLVIIFCLFVFTENAQSQDSGNHTNNNNFVKPENDLSKEKLEETDLIQYQKRAIQKVQEYYQYLEAMANVQHIDAVRDKALQMAEQEFEEGAQIATNQTMVKIHDYLTQCRAGSTYKSLIKTEVSQKLSFQSEGSYETKIKVIYANQNSKKPIKNPKEFTEEVKVVLKKKVKMFGSTKKVIWEFYLGNIEG